MILGGSRISQQLCEYNPRRLGISSFHNCLYYRKPFKLSCCSSLSPLYSRLPSFIRASSVKCTLSPKRSFRLSTKRSSSSSITSNNEDLGSVSFLSSNYCVQTTTRLSDCLSSAEDGQDSPCEKLSPVAGGIVALGKFDALHIGHRELAIQAAKIGVPFLLSFIGMAEILGWEPRPPVVAICDRKRILSSWGPLCSNLMPKEFQLEFSKVRNLTPKEFIEKLSNEFGVRGVVAGQNYRFGYKAAGDASDLLRLCEEYGMRACIINSVMDKTQKSRVIGSNNSKEQGQVSSTCVRLALANGDMKYVAQLLGRNHRLILQVKSNQMVCKGIKKSLSAPRSSLLNLPPKEGLYENCSLFIGDEDEVLCKVIIDKKDVHLEWDQISPCKDIDLFGLEFNESIY